jgi:PAS domain S-box-containing protein
MASSKILIADDHEAFRRSLRSLIESRTDWRVCAEAADGQEAVEKAQKLRPDLVLLDVSMPRMSGLVAARRIREEVPEAKILIVSQNEADLMREASHEAGADGFLSKSSLSQELLQEIQTLSAAGLGANGSQPKPAVPAKKEIPPAKFEHDFLTAEGEMAARMAELDWSKTPLGPVEEWPQSLKTSVSICLASRFPIVMYWGPEYVVLYNDAYSAILGSKHPWALGQPCRVCWAEIWDTIGPMLDGVVTSGQATWSDNLLLLLRRNGYPEECYFSFSFSPIRVESGAIGGVFTAVIETSEHVIGERRLKTLRDLAAGAVNAKSEADVLNIVSETLARNPHCIPFSVLCSVSSQSQVNVLNTAGIERSHPLCVALSEPGSMLSKKLEEAARSRQALEIHELDTWAAHIPTGAWKIPAQTLLALPIGELGRERAPGLLLAAVNPHKLPAGSYLTFFQLLAYQISTSLADARSHEEERRRAEALAELDRAKTLFFSNVSHEFRTPLTLMLGPLEDALAAANEVGSNQRDNLEVAHRNSLRLLKLVNTLLDFSRIEAGRIQACYEPTDLATLTVELASVFRSAVERAGLRLTVDCPPISEAVYVDREMWEKIVFNLLSNAFKFTFDGEIEVSLRSVNAAVELSVRDTGTGIPANEIPQLFERFHRVKGARGRSYEGSGIGLALVHELVKLHGGNIDVESKVDRGSTFTVRIPLGKDHLPPERIQAERTEVSTAMRGEAYVQEALRWLPEQQIADELPIELATNGEPSIKSPDEARSAQAKGLHARIVLADDNADMREYVRRLLSDRYEVIAVGDGEAALAKAHERAPDLILSDVMMPRLDGFGLLRAVRADETLKSVPVILLSARAGEESRVEGLNAGADDYLVKPFSARELRARVNSSLQMASLRREAAEAAHETELRFREIIDALPAAIYTTDADGRLTHFNQAAVRFSGHTPQLGTDQWCVSWKLYYPDGTPMRHDECPMAIALREGRIIEGAEAIAERPDGTRRWFTPFPTPLRDKSGKVIGGINMLVDITERKEAERTNSLLAAIVDSSDDAIISKNLDGVIMSWNKGAERIFGYTAEEAVGQHITLLIPQELHAEENEILARLRRGERIDHFQTTRRRKDGTTLNVSLTISPVRDSRGRVVGASKVARDITAQKRVDEALRQNEERFRKLSESLDAEVRARTLELEQRNADVLRQSEQLRELSWRLLRIQDDERRRVARELHDSAGQTLTVLGMNLAQTANKVQKLAPSLTTNMQQAEELIQQLHQEIRTMSYLLHPPLLDETGLAAALTWYVEGLRSRSRLQMTLSVADDLGRLPSDMELVIFRVVQECLTNIHRHSGSKTAAITIARTPESITVEVRDRGKGMAPKKLAQVQSRGSGVGISGMRERVHQLHGDIRIESNSSGTRVFVTFPLPAERMGKDRQRIESLPAAV